MRRAAPGRSDRRHARPLAVLALLVLCAGAGCRGPAGAPALPVASDGEEGVVVVGLAARELDAAVELRLADLGARPVVTHATADAWVVTWGGPRGRHALRLRPERGAVWFSALGGPVPDGGDPAGWPWRAPVRGPASLERPAQVELDREGGWTLVPGG